MAQRDFTGAYKNKPLTAKEITTKKSQLEKEKINLQKLKNLNLKGGIQRANFLTRYNNSIAIIKNLEDELKIAPEKRMGATDKNIATGLSLSGYRDSMGGMGEPNNPNFKRGIPSSRTATETSQPKDKKQSEDGQPPARNNARQKLINLKGTLAKAPPIPKPRPNTNKDMPIPKPRPNISESKNYSPRIEKMLRKQAKDRLDNPELGYEQFGGLEIGDEEPSTQKIDENVNALEKLVSRIVGKNIRFEDIPEDDPFITDMPQNYQNLRRGGQVKRMGHGGAITPEQKKRISRIVQENKARKSKSTKATPTATTSKKRAAPFSDMKKARMNGNKKRTNR